MVVGAIWSFRKGPEKKLDELRSDEELKPFTPSSLLYNFLSFSQVTDNSYNEFI